jgi:uncharacterized protein YeeX (DUF496 family)
MIDNFPIDIQLRIMRYLTPEDISTVGTFCKEWKFISENISKNIIERDLQDLKTLNSDLLKQVENGLNLDEYLSAKVSILTIFAC